MTDEVKELNRAVAQSFGFLSIWFSRLDARLAYAVLFLTCDSMSLPDETHESKMLKLLSCSTFGPRLNELKKLVRKIELSEQTRKGWGDLFVRWRRISVHRNDLQHGVWESSSEGLGTVVRRRRGDSQTIEILRWSPERIRLLAEAIHDEIPILVGALLRPEITGFRKNNGWSPYPGLNGSDKATAAEVFGNTLLP